MDGGGSTEELEWNLAEVARAPCSGTRTVEGSLRLTVELAVAAVEGCDAAGIFVVRAAQHAGPPGGWRPCSPPSCAGAWTGSSRAVSSST